MITPPLIPTAADVLSTVQRWWEPAVSGIEYLPAGFGAHHWRVDCAGLPALFVTLDRPSPGRSTATFEQAYAAAAELERRGMAGVLAPVKSSRGTFTVPLADGLLSVTPWVDGHTLDEDASRADEHESQLAQLLGDLHQSPALPGLPLWRPRIDPGFIPRLKRLLSHPWDDGPFGEPARAMTSDSIGQIEVMAERYGERVRAALADQDLWVPTHGEPHFANQMIVAGTLRLIDWESFARAPAERDMLNLAHASRTWLGYNPAMLELFRLEWRLSEIDEYSQRFHGAHAGDADDQRALAKLRKEIAGR